MAWLERTASGYWNQFSTRMTQWLATWKISFQQQDETEPIRWLLLVWTYMFYDWHVHKKTTSIKQQAPSAYSALWRTKGCNISLDWHHSQVSQGTRDWVFTKLWTLREARPWQHYIQSKQWPEKALRASIFNQAGWWTKWACPGLCPKRVEALWQTNCITLLCRGVIYTIFLRHHAWRKEFMHPD